MQEGERGSVRKRVDETPVSLFRKRALLRSMLVGGKLMLIPTDQLFPLLLFSPKASVFEGIMDSPLPHIFFGSTSQDGGETFERNLRCFPWGM